MYSFFFFFLLIILNSESKKSDVRECHSPLFSWPWQTWRDFFFFMYLTFLRENMSQLQRCVPTPSTAWAPSVARRRGDSCWWIVCFFWRSSTTDEIKNIRGSEQALVKLSVEAKGTIRRRKSPRTTQLFRTERRDGIVVTGTIPLEQIYNFISDDIRTHTHTHTQISG